MRKLIYFVAIAGVIFLSSSCSKFRKLEKSQDWKTKFNGAMEYFNDKEYYKASVLFEQIKPLVRGLPESEKVDFHMAYCEYYQKNYLLAAEYFKNFYEVFGRSIYAEEARFMHAFSLYESTPTFNLDQTESINAMRDMQEFLNRYPNSKNREKAITIINDIQQKLERKGFENARQYFKIRSYKAAVVSLNNFKNNFPDSKYIEEAEYLVIVCQYNLAERSIQSKQKERYQEVVNSYIAFVDRYPTSTFLRDAEKMYSESLTYINRSKNNTI